MYGLVQTNYQLHDRKLKHYQTSMLSELSSESWMLIDNLDRNENCIEAKLSKASTL